MEDIQGKIESVTFQNRATGFHILKIKLDGKSELVSVKGSFPDTPIDIGLKAKFSGTWYEHPVYGRQFQATFADVVAEKGRVGVMTYLSANVRSIGPITAAKMYDALGDGLLAALESDHDKIKELPFLTRPQVESILKEWSVSSEKRTSAIFLSDLGLNASQIKSVYTKFGEKTKEEVTKNPYIMYECPHVGFTTADGAARKLGIGVDDPRRIRSILMFVMSELCQSEGHMYCTSDQIKAFQKKMFKQHSIEQFSHGDYIHDLAFYQAINDLKKSGHIISDEGRIYLTHNWFHEFDSASYVSKIIAKGPCELGDLTQILADFESQRKVALSDQQREAFMMLERSRIGVVSGFPGTGKTLLVSAFVYLFEKMNLNYSLLSPTGIAAKRLSQVTGKSAATIHRALGFKKDGTWEFNSSNKFIVDAVIVDESSMIDGAVFHHLISALPASTILICVGDSAQLPSVGAGYVLNNMMQCEAVPHTALTRIYRQDKQSDIITVAHAILNENSIETKFDKDSEFVFLNFPREGVIAEMCKMASALKARNANFQVISPVYNGELGVNSLNQSLRMVLNDNYISGTAQKLKHGEVDLYEGDRVMVTKNDYERAIYNGDVGKITRISIKNDEVDVKIFGWFDNEAKIPTYVDKIFTFKVEEARSVLKVAYACTVHKVQGQEFDYVLLPMTMQYGIMLYKNLVYTAITRAKKKVFIFGDPNAFTHAAKNDRDTTRNSNLSQMIRNSILGGAEKELESEQS